MMNRILYGVWAFLLVSCSQLELPEMAMEPVMMSVHDSVEYTKSQPAAEEWTIERVYFLDNSGGLVARVKREDLAGKWYFYKSVDKGEQIMMSEVSHQLFRKNICEYPRVVSTFVFADEEYRIHRYDEQTMTPQYHFLIISQK